MRPAEFWLLDSVIETWYPLECLASNDDMYLVFNRRGHGLTPETLVSVLDRLFQDGDLIAKHRADGEPQGTFVPTRPEIEAALAGALKVYYGLKLKGGARWEAVSLPDWNRYFDAFLGIDPEVGTIISRDRKLVETYLSLCHYAWNDIFMIAGSERWDVLKPWEATYWKTLPDGHRIQFEYKSREAAAVTEPPPSAKEFFEEIRNWYTRD